MSLDECESREFGNIDRNLTEEYHHDQCWKDLDRPAQVQLDNARELCGWGVAARYLSRVIRLCLRFGVDPVFIPPGMPEHNGSVENFNGWFQEPLFQRRFKGQDWPRR